MGDPAVKEKGWYKQWRHTVAQNLEQVSRWGAKKIFLVGVKGAQVNYCTMMEWPAFLEDLQTAMKSGNIRVDWGIISEMRIEIDDLPAFVSMFAKGDSFIIVASCPNTQFDTASKMILGNRNCVEAWGRIDDMSGMSAPTPGCPAVPAAVPPPAPEPAADHVAIGRPPACEPVAEVVSQPAQPTWTPAQLHTIQCVEKKTEKKWGDPALTALTVLRLGENWITDVTPLQHLTALTVLGLALSQITAADPTVVELESRGVMVII